MTRTGVGVAVAAALVAASSYGVHADVRADQKTKIQFAGVLGRMVSLFGGRAARDGVTTSEMVKGDRMASVSDDTEQIVDLAEEKLYELDLKKKTYRVTTFEELRQRMEDAMRRAREQAENQPEAAPAQSSGEEPQMEVDFDVKDTGERKRINGFDTHQAIMTITLRQKDKTLEENGGMVLTSDMWLTPAIPAYQEIVEFQRRFAEKFAAPMLAGASEEQMSTALAMYPMMKQGLERLGEESAKLEGIAVQTVTTFEAVKSAAQMAEEQKAQADDQPSASGGLGGIVGGFARRAARRKPSEPSPRVAVMTSTSEVLKVSTSVADSDVAVPAGFREIR